MNNLYYCLDCKRIIDAESQCGFCNSVNIKALKVGSPVNVAGTKIKGRVLKIRENSITLIVLNEMNEKEIREYKPEQLKKIL